MPKPLISLLHPTARVTPSEAFPRGWKDAHDAWLSRADHPERIEYILAVHESRMEAYSAEQARIVEEEIEDGAYERWQSFRVVKNTWRDCVVDQTNCAAGASHGLVLTGVADDYYPPEHWDTLILEAFPEDFNPDDGVDLDGEYIVLCSTGATPERDRELMIGGAITRKRYERYGFILDPDFESMFSDNWMAHVARRDAVAGLVKIIERLDIVFDHRHPIFGKGQMDEVYALQNRAEAYRQGHATFCAKVEGTRVVAVCTPGEIFRAEWTAAAFALMIHIHNGTRFILANHWAHTTNVYSTRIELADSVLTAVPKADLVLWFDDDNILTPEQFDMLVADLDAHPELAGVVGWCWCDTGVTEGKATMMSCGRQGAVDLACKRFTLDDWHDAAASGKMLITSDHISPDVFWSGFPVVLMRGSALEALGWRAFLPMVRPDVHRGFTSEDTSFFYHAHHDAGQKWAVDLRVKVPHLKVGNIEPVYVPEREREQVERVRGLSFGSSSLAAAAD